MKEHDIVWIQEVIRLDFIESLRVHRRRTLIVVVFVLIFCLVAFWLSGVSVSELQEYAGLNSNGGTLSFDVPGDEVGVREHTRRGINIFEVTAVDPAGYSINVTTSEGGGTGMLMDGEIEEGDIVVMEPVEDPTWQREGVGEYASSGDEITFITRVNHEKSPYGLYTYDTENRTQARITSD